VLTKQAVVVGIAWLALAGPARLIVVAQTSRPATQTSQPATRTTLPVAPTSRPAVQAGWPAARPNLILILAGDLAGGMAGFEGHPLIRTTNLDHLAAESVRFTRCYVPTPQDAPTRASILTGRYPHVHGVTTDGQALSPRTLTFTAELKKNGYVCGIVGQWDLPCASAREPGFGLVDYVATDAVDEKNVVATNAAQTNVAETNVAEKNVAEKNMKSLAWQGCSVWVQGTKQTADKYLTDWHGDRAIEFIEKFQNQPFFLWLSFRAPHEPLAYPPGMDSLYPLEAIDLPATVRMDPGAWRNRFNQAEPVVAFQPQTEQTLRQARAQYYAMITRLDENVGRLLKRLDELKLRDNTVVVFTANNGWALGEHRLYGQGPFFYEELVRVPLVVRCPALAPSPLKIDRVVSLVDLAPTLCELAGLPEQLGMQGTSLTALIRYPETSQHADERFFEYDQQKGKKYPVRGLVTGRYKLIDYLQGDGAFYDLALDPKETDNAIGVAEYATVINVLRSRLEFWRKQTKDLQNK